MGRQVVTSIMEERVSGPLRTSNLRNGDLRSCEVILDLVKEARDMRAAGNELGLLCCLFSEDLKSTSSQPGFSISNRRVYALYHQT